MAYALGFRIWASLLLVLVLLLLLLLLLVLAYMLAYMLVFMLGACSSVGQLPTGQLAAAHKTLHLLTRTPP